MFSNLNNPTILSTKINLFPSKHLPISPICLSPHTLGYFDLPHSEKQTQLCVRESKEFQGSHEHSAWDPITDVTHDVVRCRLLVLQQYRSPQTSVFSALMSQKRSQEEKGRGEKREVWNSKVKDPFFRSFCQVDGFILSLKPAGRITEGTEFLSSGSSRHKTHLSFSPFTQGIPTDQHSASFNQSASGSLLCFIDLKMTPWLPHHTKESSCHLCGHFQGAQQEFGTGVVTQGLSPGSLPSPPLSWVQTGGGWICHLIHLWTQSSFDMRLKETKLPQGSCFLGSDGWNFLS